MKHRFSKSAMDYKKLLIFLLYQKEEKGIRRLLQNRRYDEISEYCPIFYFNNNKNILRVVDKELKAENLGSIIEKETDNIQNSIKDYSTRILN